MKTGTVFFIISLVVSACSSKNRESANVSALTALYQQRDSLYKHIENSNLLLTEINERIADLDTTARFYTVTTFEVEPTAFEHFIEVYGTVGADKNTLIFPETGGVITSIYVRTGQKVVRGQPLAQLDASLLLSSINEVKTQLELASSVYEKQKRLWEQKVGSELQYLQAKNNKESLESRLKTLQVQYNQTVIKAPFDGVVDEIFPKVGQLVGLQSQIIRLINLDEIYIEGEISENYSSTIKPGYIARIRIPNTDVTYDAQVVAISRYINPANRTFKVRLELVDKSIRLLPNSLVSIMIRDYENPNALVIPVRLVQQDPFGNDYVLTLEKIGNTLGIARKVFIKSGKAFKNFTEVFEGIEPNTILIDKGSRNVKDGQKVRIVDNNTEDNV